MISVRLSQELEEKINSLSKRKNITKSEIIKEALEKYFESYEQSETAYDLGKDLFGKYGSGQGNLSVIYKKKVREKLNEKMSH
ncbi:MAG: hypothetical protein PWQ96_1293 [Clostridia bacterium]|jgi:predicted DNA-binding protein|nr:CopG-like protein DNA-binding [Clostridiales bacterium]MDK2985651.1 hypothetical protein [Clostridia bacterium]